MSKTTRSNSRWVPASLVAIDEHPQSALTGSQVLLRRVTDIAPRQRLEPLTVIVPVFVPVERLEQSDLNRLVERRLEVGQDLSQRLVARSLEFIFTYQVVLQSVEFLADDSLDAVQLAK